MKLNIACKISIVGLLLSVALARGETVQAINFDTSQSTISLNINSDFQLGDHTTGDYDFDGDVDDQARVLSMGTEFNPATEAGYTPGVGQNNSAFYQGVGLALINDTSNAVPDLAINRFGQSSGAVQLGNNPAPENGTLRIAAAYFWKADDFLNGPIELANDAGSIHFEGIQARNQENWNTRILIEAGSKWYVSHSTGVRELTINGATETWHQFDPYSNIFWDGNEGDPVAGSTLGAITSAGIYTQHQYTSTSNGSNPDEGPYYNFYSLSFSGSSIPEPRSYALLVGLAGLCFVMLRRR
jgi:hypothetical protein